MEKVTALKTEVGLIEGRTIYLNKILFDDERKVTLMGELQLDDRDARFEMTFGGVIYFSTIELDFDERTQLASLAIIDNSEKLKNFTKRDHSRKTNNRHRNYYIRTYDTVFEIVSDEFQFVVNP